MRYSDGKWQDLGFLESVMRTGMTPHDTARSIIVVGFDGEMQMRDAAAFALALVDHHRHGGTSFRFVRANSRTAFERQFDARTIHFFGREEMFRSSEFGLVSSCLHEKTWGRYPIPRNREPVDFIRYGDLPFSRHQIDEAPGQRYFERDYGLLIYHPIEIDGTRYGVWNECGFGTMGTGLLAKILYEPVLSRILRRQAEALVRSFHGMHPELGFELAVRISVSDREKLDRLLDCVAVPVSEETVDKLPFQFAAELAAIAQADGTPKIWTSSAPSVEMRPNGDLGGWIAMGRWQKKLPKKCYDLVGQLNGRRDGVSRSDLCRVLYPGSSGSALRELVRRTNELLAKDEPQLRAWIEHLPRGAYKLCLRPHGA
jgi:hypothetical protein